MLGSTNTQIFYWQTIVTWLALNQPVAANTKSQYITIIQQSKNGL
jgi:hypothetical protein